MVGAPGVDDATRLAIAAGSGDRAALTAFIQATQRDVWRYLAFHAGPREADDLTQETFLRVLTALPRFQGRSSARTWLLSIARRVVVDHLRHRASRPRTIGSDHWQDLADDRREIRAGDSAAYRPCRDRHAARRSTRRPAGSVAADSGPRPQLRPGSAGVPLPGGHHPLTSGQGTRRAGATDLADGITGRPAAFRRRPNAVGAAHPPRRRRQPSPNRAGGQELFHGRGRLTPEDDIPRTGSGVSLSRGVPRPDPRR